MRLMGNLTYGVLPNSSVVLTDAAATSDNLQQNPAMPKATDGHTFGEILGSFNGSLQNFTISNTLEGAGYIPGQSPHVGSNPLSEYPEKLPTILPYLSLIYFRQ